MKYLIPCLISSLFVLAFSACKRSEDKPRDFGQGLGACRLAKETRISPTGQVYGTISYRYDNEGRVGGTNSLFAGVSVSDTLLYGNNIIVRRYSDSTVRALHFEDTFVLDNEGRLTNATVSPIGPNGATHVHYDYSWDGRLAHSKYIDPRGYDFDAYYTWDKDDIVKISMAQEEIVYHYDLNRKWQVASRSPVMSYGVYGIKGFFPGHLPIRIDHIQKSPYRLDSTIINQLLDANNRITRVTDRDSSYSEYSYECL